jgi:hypothetical protein
MVVATAQAFDRPVTEPRYVYPAVVAVLIVAVIAASGWRWSRRSYLALCAVAAVGLSVNLVMLEEGASHLRSYAVDVRAMMTGMDLAGDRIINGFDPNASGLPEDLNSPWRSLREAGLDPAEAYLNAARQYGSPGYSITELLNERGEKDWAAVDATVLAAIGAHVRYDTPFDIVSRSCERFPHHDAEDPIPIYLELPPRGISVEPKPRAEADVELRRFAQTTWTSIGTLDDDGPSVIRLPQDRVERPWHVRVTAEAIQVCALTFKT